MRSQDDLVSVIIPAYNAQTTIDQTLCSVRGQTHPELEIIVVDDGSLDRTAEIVARHAALDTRIRFVSQSNGGVAAARNRAIALARATYVAPIDADDLWAPDKIALQLAAMRGGPGRVGLVYTWFAVIDADSRVVLLDARSQAEGDVVEALCQRNIVGNGSSPLMLRAAVIEAGGYDEGLRDQGAEGCEDYKLYFSIAENYEVKLVRQFLTGYRETPANMSSDLGQMLRSRDLCAAEFVRRRPQFRRAIARSRTRLMRFNAARSFRGGDYGAALRGLGAMIKSDLVGTVATLFELGVSRLRPRALDSSGRVVRGVKFPVGKPREAATDTNRLTNQTGL